MRACVVHSQDVDSVDAVAELIAGAKVELGASLPRVAMLFAGIDHDFAIVLEQINAQWPGIALIGCTTDGEMSSHILFAEDSLVLVLLSGDDFHALRGVRARCPSLLGELGSFWSCLRAWTFSGSPVWPGRSRLMWRGLFEPVLT